MMKDILVLVGLVCSICIICFAFWLIFEWIKDTISKAIWSYKFKHRFEKKAIAECYCRDCIYKSTYKTCIRHGNKIGVRDDFFCKFASPHKQDPDLKEKNNA